MIKCKVCGKELELRGMTEKQLEKSGIMCADCSKKIGLVFVGK